MKVADVELTAPQHFVCLEEYKSLGTIQAFLNIVYEARMHHRASRDSRFCQGKERKLRHNLTTDDQ